MQEIARGNIFALKIAKVRRWVACSKNYSVGAGSGNRKVKAVPFPGVLSTRIFP